MSRCSFKRATAASSLLCLLRRPNAAGVKLLEENNCKFGEGEGEEGLRVNTRLFYAGCRSLDHVWLFSVRRLPLWTTAPNPQPQRRVGEERNCSPATSLCVWPAVSTPGGSAERLKGHCDVLPDEILHDWGKGGGGVSACCGHVTVRRAIYLLCFWG